MSSVEKAVRRLGRQGGQPDSVATAGQRGGDTGVAASASQAPDSMVLSEAGDLPGEVQTIGREPDAGTPIPSTALGNGSSGQSGKISRKVEIDFDRLRDYGVLTPNGDHSLLAEEFRLVKRPLLLKAQQKGAGGERNANLIMVASARAGEGKTFCAASLAMSIASEPDLTVLLVDADVLRASVPTIFGIEADRGLTDVIADENLELADVMLRTQLDNFSILPAGRPHHLATEYFASGRMSRLVDDIADRYSDRIIIFDSPPVLMSSIPSVLALHVGQILFVIEADATPEAALENALSLVSSCKNISLILNKSRAIAGTETFGTYYHR